MNASKAESITRESFSIIRSRLGLFHVCDAVMEIVIRIAHTTGDVEFGKSFIIPEDALYAGIAAVRKGMPIITDVEMVRTGIREIPAKDLGSTVYCFLNDRWVVDKSKHIGDTRSALGMIRAGSLLDGAVVAIGNAPTALFRLLELIETGKARPALIIGVPVGFVGALESKQALYDSGYPAITNLSERGGSPIAAAVVNGILHLAGEVKG